MNNIRKLHVICGPTGSGKTSVAVELSKIFPLEVVSADSRQIIKYLDIGTAKPTSIEQEQLKFHLIDLIEPGESYSASKFMKDTEIAIDSILENKKIPIIVGGAGLYLRTLSEGVIDIKPDAKIRQQLEDDARRIGKDAMYQRLCEIDKEEANQLHPNNVVRVIRAIEIFEITGIRKSELIKTGMYNRSKYGYEFHCLAQSRELLYNRINERVDLMIENGLENELQSLIDIGKKEAIEKANVIGYAELLLYLNQEISKEEAINKIKQNSRRYAKRQFTWFRNQTDSKFYENSEELYKGLKKRLSEVID